MYEALTISTVLVQEKIKLGPSPAFAKGVVPSEFSVFPPVHFSTRFVYPMPRAGNGPSQVAQPFTDFTLPMA
jgi:hypothetical protein